MYPPPLDVEAVTTEHRELVAAYRARGVADAARHGDELVAMELPISDEIAATIDSRLHRLGAARETLMIESATFLEGAPTLQQSAQRRVTAAEAALAERGVSPELVALDPAPVPERARGFVGRVLAWVFKPDEDKLDALRRKRVAAVDDLREIERQIREAHAAHRHALRTGVHIARAEQSLAKAAWAAYRDGAQSALPAGARDFGGDVDCGELPELELPEWAMAGVEA